MKKIFLFIAFGLFAIGTNAQTESPKQLEEDIVGLSIKIVDKEAKLATLKERTALLSKRKDFKPQKRSPFEWLKDFKSVESLYNDSVRVKKFDKALMPLVDMYDAFINGCDKKRHEAISASLKAMTLPDSCTAELKDDFKKIKLVFDDYDYTMSELARVFKIVEKNGDGKTADSIWRILKKDDETYYIDKIQYVHDQLDTFINVSKTSTSEITKDKSSSGDGKKQESPRSKMKEKLAKDWPKAGFNSK